MKSATKVVGLGALASAGLASVCCLGPVVSAALGLGGLGMAAGLSRYRPVFLVLAGAALAFGFYQAYRKREVSCPDGSCELRSGSKTMKAGLWAVTAATVAFATFPSWSSLLVRRPAPAAASVGAETFMFSVSGMTCAACAAGIERALMKVAGVRSASVDIDSAIATVEVEPGVVPAAKLIEAVKSAGAYTAEVKR